MTEYFRIWYDAYVLLLFIIILLSGSIFVPTFAQPNSVDIPTNTIFSGTTTSSVTTSPSNPVHMSGKCEVNGKEVDCDKILEQAGGLLKMGLWILIAVWTVGLLYTIFWILMLVHALTQPIPSKVLWLLIIFFIPVIGPIVYYFAVKRTFTPESAKPVSTPSVVAWTPVMVTPVAWATVMTPEGSEVVTPSAAVINPVVSSTPTTSTAPSVHETTINISWTPNIAPLATTPTQAASESSPQAQQNNWFQTAGSIPQTNFISESVMSWNSAQVTPTASTPTPPTAMPQAISSVSETMIPPTLMNTAPASAPTQAVSSANSIPTVPSVPSPSEPVNSENLTASTLTPSPDTPSTSTN